MNDWELSRIEKVRIVWWVPEAPHYALHPIQQPHPSASNRISPGTSSSSMVPGAGVGCPVLGVEVLVVGVGCEL